MPNPRGGTTRTQRQQSASREEYSRPCSGSRPHRLSSELIISRSVQHSRLFAFTSEDLNFHHRLGNPESAHPDTNIRRLHMALPRPLFQGFVLIVLLTRIGGQSTRNFGCSPQNYCSGHGKCVAANAKSPKSYCECDQGWGGPLDPVQPDATCASREAKPCFPGFVPCSHLHRTVYRDLSYGESQRRAAIDTDERSRFGRMLKHRSV